MDPKKKIENKAVILFSSTQLEKYEKIKNNLMDYLTNYDSDALLNYYEKIPRIIERLKLKLFYLTFLRGYFPYKNEIKSLKKLKKFFKYGKKEIHSVLVTIKKNDEQLYNVIVDKLILETKHDCIRILISDRVYEIWKVDNFDRRLRECVRLMGFLDVKRAADWFKQLIINQSGEVYLKNYLNATESFFRDNIAN